MLIYLKIMSLDIAFLSLFSEKLANNMKLCDSRWSCSYSRSRMQQTDEFKGNIKGPRSSG